MDFTGSCGMSLTFFNSENFILRFFSLSSSKRKKIPAASLNYPENVINVVQLTELKVPEKRTVLCPNPLMSFVVKLSIMDLMSHLMSTKWIVKFTQKYLFTSVSFP